MTICGSSDCAMCQLNNLSRAFYICYQGLRLLVLSYFNFQLNVEPCSFIKNSIDVISWQWHCYEIMVLDVFYLLDVAFGKAGVIFLPIIAD